MAQGPMTTSTVTAVVPPQDAREELLSPQVSTSECWEIPTWYLGWKILGRAVICCFIKLPSVMSELLRHLSRRDLKAEIGWWEMNALWHVPCSILSFCSGGAGCSQPLLDPAPSLALPCKHSGLEKPSGLLLTVRRNEAAKPC